MMMPAYKAANRLTMVLDDSASGDLSLKPLLVYHSMNLQPL